MAQFPGSQCQAFNQLFYPTILLIRYIHPDPWDAIFMSTVRSLRCDTRSDMLARPGPQRMSQLGQYVRRMSLAYVTVGMVHWLVSYEGIMAGLRVYLALMATCLYLVYRNVPYLSLVIPVMYLFPGPRWAIWLVRIVVQQELFMYDLLQPYLARAQFKSWQRRAWLQRYEMELRGFALGAWCVCALPRIGVAAIPFMFPAVAYLLSKSCGSMDITGDGFLGESHTSEIKAVALGQNKAVASSWDDARVDTFIYQPNPEGFGPDPYKDAATNNSFRQVYQKNTTPVSEADVRKASGELKQRKLDRYHEYQTYQQSLFLQPSVGSVSSAPSGPSVSVSPAQPEASKNSPQHGSNSRKPSETTPSTPPAPSFIPPRSSGDMLGWSENFSHSYHGEEVPPESSSSDDASGPQPYSTTSTSRSATSSSSQDDNSRNNYWRMASQAMEWPEHLTRQAALVAEGTRRFAEQGQRMALESHRRADAGRRNMEESIYRAYGFSPEMVKKKLGQMILGDGGHSNQDGREGGSQSMDDRASFRDTTPAERDEPLRRRHGSYQEEGSSFGRSERIPMPPRGMSDQDISNGTNTSSGDGIRNRQHYSHGESEPTSKSSDFDRKTRPAYNLGQIVTDSIFESLDSAIDSAISPMRTLYPTPTPSSSRRAASSMSSSSASSAPVRPRLKSHFLRGGLSEIIAGDMQRLNKTISDELEELGSKMRKRTPHVIKPPTPSTLPPLDQE